jgi:hypothetical protein
LAVLSAVALCGVFVATMSLQAADTHKAEKPKAETAKAAAAPTTRPACPHCKPGEPCAKCAAKAAKTLKARGEAIARKAQLHAALTAIDKATLAVESGDKEAALAALAGARKLVAAAAGRPTGAAAAARPRRRFVNDRCPMMGTKINPAKVPASLTRTFRGEKVAFCCPGCPAAWDELTDVQRAMKLAAVIAN